MYVAKSTRVQYWFKPLDAVGRMRRYALSGVRNHLYAERMELVTWLAARKGSEQQKNGSSQNDF